MVLMSDLHEKISRASLLFKFYGLIIFIVGMMVGDLIGNRTSDGSDYKDIILDNMYDLKLYLVLDNYLQSGNFDRAKYTIDNLIRGQIAILTDKEALKILNEEDRIIIENLKLSKDRQGVDAE